MKTKFTMEHLLNLYLPVGNMPFDLSPNGRFLAIQVKPIGRGDTTREPHTVFTVDGVSLDAAGSRVTVIDVETQYSFEPFPPKSTSWGAQWSPDGRLLAAYVQDKGRACLGIWDSESQRCQLWRDVWVRPNYGFEVPRWTPDGQKVVVKLLSACHRDKVIVHPKEKSIPAPSVIVKSFDPPADEGQVETAKENLSVPDWFEDEHGDLASIDISNGETKRLATDWYFRCFRISPDGRSVAVFRLIGEDEKARGNVWHLAIVPLDGGAVKEMMTPIYQSFGSGFSWSPDGQYIAYRTNPGRILVASVEGDDPPRDITGDASVRLRKQYSVDESPRWSRDGQTLYYLSGGKVWILSFDGKLQRYVDTEEIGRSIQTWVLPAETSQIWTPDGRSIPVIVRDPETRKDGLACLDLETGKSHLIKELDRICSYGHPTGQEVAPDGSACYLAMETSDCPQEIWRVLLSGPASRLYSPSSDLDKIAFGKAQMIEWRALNGQTVTGALMLPPDYAEGHRLPLLVHVYPGYDPTSLFHNFGFGEYGVEHAQILAAQGYAVLYPDMPVPDLEPMREFPGLVLTAVDRVIEMGIADPDRVGILGHSFGGYCVVSLLTQTERFRAGVSLCGGGFNMTSFYGQMHWGYFERGQGGMGGTLWEKRARYIESSPLFYLDRLSAPLLLISGTAERNDTNQAEEVFNALRRLDKQVEWRSYLSEGHHPNDWSEVNLKDMCNVVLGWFDKFLKN